MSRKTIGQRIAEARKAKGWSQTHLSMKCGWGENQSRVSNYEQGRSNPSVEDVAKMAQALGTNSAYLAFGDISERMPELSPSIAGTDSVVHIQPVEISGSSDPLLLDRKLFPQTAAVEQSARWFDLHDNAMDPVIPLGSTVVIDTASTQLMSGRRYGISHGGILSVRSVYQLPKGAIRLRAKNTEDWPDEIVQDIELDSLHILGQVIWYSVSE